MNQQGKYYFTVILDQMLVQRHLSWYYEVMDMKNIPIYAMPKMKSFLENNAPFNFLIEST